jgi:ribonuclease D
MMKIEIPVNGSYQNDKRISGKMINRGYPENISIEEIQLLELSWFRGEIIMVDKLKTFNNVFPDLKKEKILGFDTETKPSFRKGQKNKVSLIQLATHDKAYLFRINKLGFPPALAGILADNSIIKVGVAVHDDIKFLRNIKKFNPDSFIDLQTYVRDFGIQSSGLKKLAAIILGFRISKRQQVTDWEAEELSEPQQLYAATDAWVCYEIYSKLKANYNCPFPGIPPGRKE